MIAQRWCNPDNSPRRCPSGSSSLVDLHQHLWNILNFRSGLLLGLMQRDTTSSRLHRATNTVPAWKRWAAFRTIRIDNKGANPIRDLALRARYTAALRAIQPVAFS